MARQNLALFKLLLLTAFLLESPRLHAESRTIQRRAVQSPTTDFPDELTTQQTFTTDANVFTTQNESKELELPQATTLATLTSESISSEKAGSIDANESPEMQR